MVITPQTKLKSIQFLQISHCHMQNAWQSCASQVVFRLSSILGAVGLFRSEMRLILTLIWPWFFCRTVSFYLSAVSLSRQRQDILNFSCWPLSRIFHVTWPICKKFRYWFRLRSSLVHLDLHLVVDQLITSLLTTPCWQDLTRSKQLSTVAILGFQFVLKNLS